MLESCIFIYADFAHSLTGRGSYLHGITVDNKLIRLRHDGLILYSMRYTVVADCRMDFRSFPMDNQDCPLYITSC